VKDGNNASKIHMQQCPARLSKLSQITYTTPVAQTINNRETNKYVLIPHKLKPCLNIVISHGCLLSKALLAARETMGPFGLNHA
jgi:hypothetical protein